MDHYAGLADMRLMLWLLPSLSPAKSRPAHAPNAAESRMDHYAGLANMRLNDAVAAAKPAPSASSNEMLWIMIYHE